MTTDPATLAILHYPHPSLRRKAEAVDRVDETVRAVAARMIELMHEAEGVGLAAPQVGLAWRLFVANPREDDDVDRVFVNPRLSRFAPTLEVHEEGCLSLPGITADIRRPNAVTITATDLDGREFSLTSDCMAARIWQHECDHLDGVLIIDKMSPMDRIALRRAIKELEAAAQQA